MRYRSFPTRESATAESKEMLRRLNPAAYVEDRGLPPGTQHGPGPRIPEDQGWTTMAVPVEEGTGRLAGRFLVLDDAGSEVADDEIKRSDEDLVLAAR